MEVNFIRSGSSYQMSVDGKLFIRDCEVTVEENLCEQLENIRLENCIINAKNATFYTEHAGLVYKQEPTDKLDPFKEEGIAIYVKGKLVYGIHPNNLESNVEALDNGSMKFDWKTLVENANKGEKN